MSKYIALILILFFSLKDSKAQIYSRWLKGDSILVRLRMNIAEASLKDKYELTNVVKKVMEMVKIGDLKPYYADSVSISDEMYTIEGVLDFIGETEVPTKLYPEYEPVIWDEFQQSLRIQHGILLTYPWERELKLSKIKGYKLIPHPLSRLMDAIEVEGILIKRENKHTFRPTSIILCTTGNKQELDGPPYVAADIDYYDYIDDKLNKVQYYLRGLEYDFEVTGIDGKYLIGKEEREDAKKELGKIIKEVSKEMNKDD